MAIQFNVRPNHSKSLGLSIIEVLVVIGIIGLLAALLLPALQASRGSSSRLHCANNLRQIGLALHGYAEIHGYFPSINAPSLNAPISPPNVLSAHSYSPLVRMLPQLEQSTLFDQINFAFIPTFSASLAVNDTVMSQRVGLFVCPSDPSASPAGYGRVNYRFNHGPTPVHSPWPERPLSFSGPFTVHKFYRPSDFSRGLSQVVGVSERTQGDWTKGVFSRGDYRLPHPQVTNLDESDADAMIRLCESLPNDDHESRSGEAWFLGGNHFTTYNHVNVPNAEVPDCSHDDVTEGIHNRTLHAGQFSARSHHSGGVNTLRMDGHLEFVADGIDLTLWRQLAQRIETATP